MDDYSLVPVEHQPDWRQRSHDLSHHGLDSWTGWSAATLNSFAEEKIIHV